MDRAKGFLPVGLPYPAFGREAARSKEFYGDNLEVMKRMFGRIKVDCYRGGFFRYNVRAVVVQSVTECITCLSNILFGTKGAGDEVD
jgi:hypothetical protein